MISSDEIELGTKCL